MAEPKQNIAGRHGTDSRTLGVISESVEEVSHFCRLAQSNGEKMENVQRMAERLRLLALEDSNGFVTQVSTAGGLL